MDRRLELQSELEKILGSRNVYYQPLPSLKLQYPCIVYERNPGDPIVCGQPKVHQGEPLPGDADHSESRRSSKDQTRGLADL